jgi:hypothetical protein
VGRKELAIGSNSGRSLGGGSRRGVRNWRRGSRKLKLVSKRILEGKTERQGAMRCVWGTFPKGILGNKSESSEITRTFHVAPNAPKKDSR